MARRWRLDCPKHPNANVSLGFGLKLPTGNYDARDSFRDMAGNRAARYLDISSQPRDGGVGLICNFQAFHQMNDSTLFASGTYLANPRNANGTPSLIVGLMSAGAPPGARVSSGRDQYVLLGGVIVPISAKRGLSQSLAGRLEGIRTDDLFGDSDGVRSAGYAVSIEPTASP